MYNYQPNPFINRYNYQMSQQQILPTQVQNTLNGKIVDSIDVAKSYDVPIGSYAILPKADMEEIYVKQWNNNGSTRIDKYKKIVYEEEQDLNKTTLEDIMECIKDLNKKIDNIQKPATRKKKVEVDEYDE